MKLVIVESPSKAKTISNFLSKEYEVIASRGHISDLVKYGKGIEYVDGDFKLTYEITKDHKHVASEIRALAKKAEVVYLATDEDREGEAIAFSIVRDILGGEYTKYPRIAFHEITKTAILNALANPRKIDMLKVDAQVTRRVLDRVVGFSLTRLLGKKFNGKLTAGRVQSCVVNLLVEREIAIENFIPVTYFNFNGLFKFTNNGKELELNTQLHAYDPNKLIDPFKGNVKEKNASITIFQDENESKEILKQLSNREYRLLEPKKSEPKNVKPKPPFMTSTLQQHMSNVSGYSPTKTMQIAQKLYEGVEMPEGRQGAITYMRTDSLNIAKEAQDMALEFIRNNYGNEYIPSKPNIYSSTSKGAQEAHEAIRPTNINFTPEIAKKYLEPDELKVYTAVYERFLASQSVPAKVETTNIFVVSDIACFKTSGKVTVFDGFYRLAPNLASDDKPLPKFDYINNLPSTYKEIKMVEKQTEPPARYTEASLVNTMEQEGIGRPSTYASTVGLIVNRQYALVDKNRMFATDKAKDICRGLSIIYPEVLSNKMTYEMEEVLDRIASGEIKWKEYLGDFYTVFNAKCEEVDKNIQSEKVSVEVGRECPNCGKPLLERTGRYGKFVSCSGYPKCKYIEDKNKNKKELKVVGKCPNCGKDIVERHGTKGIFYTCSGFPRCKLAFSTPISDEKCPLCKSIGYKQNDKFYCLKNKCKNAKPKFFRKRK